MMRLADRMLANAAARAAARQYRLDARRLRRLAAFDHADDPDEQARIRYRADMADHAADMELAPQDRP